MARGLEHRIQSSLDIFPKTVAPWLDHHTTADIAIFGEICRPNDLLIPFWKVLVSSRINRGLFWLGLAHNG